jgi:hypothetical protein
VKSFLDSVLDYLSAWIYWLAIGAAGLALAHWIMYHLEG